MLVGWSRGWKPFARCTLVLHTTGYMYNYLYKKKKKIIQSEINGNYNVSAVYYWLRKKKKKFTIYIRWKFQIFMTIMHICSFKITKK